MTRSCMLLLAFNFERCDGAAQRSAGGLGEHEQLGHEGGRGRRRTCYWSHLSQLPPWDMFLVLETPQAALLEAAQGAFSVILWPQP